MLRQLLFNIAIYWSMYHDRRARRWLKRAEALQRSLSLDGRR